MPVTVHVGLQRTDGPLFKYEREPAEVAFGGDPIRVLTRFGGNSGLNAVQLLLSGVFDRYPKLRMYWAETQIGWLPYYYEQLDDVYKRSRFWMERYFSLKPLEQQPSQILREHFYWGFIYDPIGLRLRYDIGVDRIMWGNDFPHSAGDWPNSRRIIEDMFSGVPTDEKQRILVDNAVEFFHLN
jgi:predicted TIM-barrel fold metal-dependent hydrolase